MLEKCHGCGKQKILVNQVDRLCAECNEYAMRQIEEYLKKKR